LNEPYFLINSVVRTLNFIEYLSEKGEVSVSDCSNHFNINKSTAHRFLASMKHVGFVDQNPENQKYKLSLKIFEIGNKIISNLNFREVAKPIMMELGEQTGETINLGIIDNFDVVYIEKVLSKNALRLDSPIGGRDPVHSTALGKAIIAFRPSDYVEEYVKTKGLSKSTKNTITNVEKFYTELKIIREKGYAIDAEETMIGLQCVSAPIFNNKNKAVAAISISSPTQRLNKEIIAKYTQLVKDAATKISKQLGARIFI
jgi:IclR family KDG regulon transcriptional repressor